MLRRQKPLNVKIDVKLVWLGLFIKDRVLTGQRSPWLAHLDRLDGSGGVFLANCDGLIIDLASADPNLSRWFNFAVDAVGIDYRAPLSVVM